MRKRPLRLFLSALFFAYFPVEWAIRLANGFSFYWVDAILSGLLPIILVFGLIRVSRIGWYTLVALVALWGVRDLYHFYFGQPGAALRLVLHLAVYGASLLYFINPRIRHIYFDPKLRWWRVKRRYETHLPFLLNHNSNWHYPLLTNVSEGGCFIETTHLLEVDSQVEIAIPLPCPLTVSVIKTKGEVRWVSKNPLRYGMGIQFISPTAVHHKALRTFVRGQDL